jgi:hypothetical protein
VPAGRGVSRTTGTQYAGWVRMRGRTGMVLRLAAAALAGAAETIGVDGGGDGVLQEGRVHGRYRPTHVPKVT